MPNWCDNSVELYNDDVVAIDNLFKFLKEEKKEEDGLFMYLRPRPENQDFKWFNWNIDNWGTKWDVSPDSFDRYDTNSIVLSFETAWGPPCALYDYLAANGWKVNAMYHEPGVGFVGEHVDGVDRYFEYSFDNENSLKEIPKDLAEYANIWSDYDYHIQEKQEENK